MVPHCLVLVSASNYYWVCLVSPCIEDAPLSHMAGAYTLSFFKIKGGTLQPCLGPFGPALALDSSTTKFKGFFSNPMYFSISLQSSVTEKSNQKDNL